MIYTSARISKIFHVVPFSIIRLTLSVFLTDPSLLSGNSVPSRCSHDESGEALTTERIMIVAAHTFKAALTFVFNGYLPTKLLICTVNSDELWSRPRRTTEAIQRIVSKIDTMEFSSMPLSLVEYQ
jgi:hypothetical protein